MLTKMICGFSNVYTFQSAVSSSTYLAVGKENNTFGLFVSTYLLIHCICFIIMYRLVYWQTMEVNGDPGGGGSQMICKQMKKKTILNCRIGEFIISKSLYFYFSLIFLCVKDIFCNYNIYT